MVDTISTIAALATAPVVAGVAVVRISGPRAAEALAATFRSTHSPVAAPRRLVRGAVMVPGTEEVLDRALAVFMRSPNTFTGEDVVELHLHGSPLLAQRVLRCLYGLGITPAAPGEFTKRAFLNGRLDLVQAEAVNDLITASSDYAIKIANEHLAGRFSSAIDNLGDPLRNLLSEIEAQLDFPEDDIERFLQDDFLARLRSVHAELRCLIDSYASGRVLKDGFRVLLAGAPNVGKSSLLNNFLGCERAIVTDISGTTRDLLEETALIDGVQFIFCDSAGITAQPDNQVEAIGVARARQMFEWADLVLWLIDASQPCHADGLVEVEGVKEVWLVVNKIDLLTELPEESYGNSEAISKDLRISVKTGEGIDSLKATLVNRVRGSLSQAECGCNIVTSERQQLALRQAEQALIQASNLLKDASQLELVSFELRTALNCLEEIVGKTYSEDILGLVFDRFCIGK